MQTIIVAFALSLLFFQSSGRGPKTDREFDDLNGPVRFVRIEMDAYKTNTRVFEKIVAYDVSGRVTEEIRGSRDGCVLSRHVFSYDAGGNRTEAIYPGTTLGSGDKSDSSQSPASPLIHKQVFKLDGAGRRSELDQYDNTGRLFEKSFYKYDDQGRLKEIIQETDAARWRCEFKYNDKGLASEKKYQNLDSSFIDRWQYAYEYDYDAHGNWIKRIAKYSGVSPRTSYRELKYYPSQIDQSQQEEMGDRFDPAKLAPCPLETIRRPGDTLKLSATRKIIPLYPPDAKKARINGSVVVEVTVDETGRVIAVRSISGPVELRGVSEEAARGWHFSASPVYVIGTITFHFYL